MNHDAGIYGMTNIHMAGKSLINKGAILRGDLQTIKIGKLTIIGENSIIRPPTANYGMDGMEDLGSYLQLSIGENVYIGDNSVIQAAAIGSFVYIGKNCVIVG